MAAVCSPASLSRPRRRVGGRGPQCAGLQRGLLGADAGGRSRSPSRGHRGAPCLCPQGERATGFGVALLLALFGGASEDPLLNLVSPLGCEVDPQEGDVERDSKRRRLV